MRLLLDSHVLLWWLDDPQKLAPALRPTLQEPTNDVFFSPASIWELGLKMAEGHLRMPVEIETALEEDGIEEPPIAALHATRAFTLPTIHDDPFDRLLITQALAEGLVRATRDTTIARYDVPVMDA